MWQQPVNTLATESAPSVLPGAVVGRYRHRMSDTELPEARLARLMRAANLNDPDLATKADTSRQQIHKFRTGKLRISRHWAERLAPHLNTTWLDLMGWSDSLPSNGQHKLTNEEVKSLGVGVASNVSFTPDAPAPPIVTGAAIRDVPVLGTARAGTEGSFILHTCEGPIDYAPRPPAFPTADSIFGLLVSGTSMMPRFRQSELIYVHKHREPRVGDDVVVVVDTDQPGEPPVAYLKTLKGETATHLLLEQWNPPSIISLPLNRVRERLLVLTTSMLMGF